MSFLRTAFQTTRGARSANSDLAWFQRVRVGGRVAYLRDPSGNLIELFQSLPQQE